MPIENLRFGMKGTDVRQIKEQLFQLGWYGDGITSIRKDSFGKDTLVAVKAFQRANGLAPDGIVGPLTRKALENGMKRENAAETGDEASQEKLPGNIGAIAAKAIGADLEQASSIRHAIVLDALQFAYDPAVSRRYPLSLYIRGANLYNTDLTPNVITLSRIASGAKRQPAYYDAGRREMMEAAVRADSKITGADCSGGVVGLLRHAGATARDFDLSADGFLQSGRCRSVAKAQLLAGDLVHKPGHIGLYAGGGYVVEWMGGAYGCQLTKLASRRGYSFVSGKIGKMGAWTGFLRPSYY